MEENKKFKCYFCDREFESQQGFVAHMKNCVKNPFKSLSHDKRQYVFTCSKCGKTFIKYISEYSYEFMKFRNKLPMCCCRSCANSHAVSDKTKEKISIGVKNFNKRNNTNTSIKGKLKPHLIKKCICKYCGKEFTYIKGESLSKLHCSSECKHKYRSEHTGGYRKGSGYGKSGWYKGIYCDSSWELAFVVYHLDNKLKIERCKEKRKYIFNNKEHIYIPDFITDKGVFEIKGYKTEQWAAKEQQNSDIKVLYKNDMEFYINYAIQKYGSNFISLYDSSGNKEVALDQKDAAWFYKVNNENKTYINVFVVNREDFKYYIGNGWNVGRTPKNVFADYKNVRYKVKRKILSKIKIEEDKEKYFSSLL